MNKDVVRRILAVRYHPKPDAGGAVLAYSSRPREGQFVGIDLFGCESAILRIHWVLVVMDQFTRRIVGFGVHRAPWMAWGCVACSTSDAWSHPTDIAQLGP